MKSRPSGLSQNEKSAHWGYELYCKAGWALNKGYLMCKGTQADLLVN